VVGIAARPTATNVVAGVQIALSQPIRVDDVVVVETQWGRIEEIALTDVVVRVWDLRRLVLPISYFVDQPFENWTRSTADILGWVYVEVDDTAPVEELRRAFREIVAGSPNWNGKVCGLQVTNLGSETMQLRALMISADSTRSWAPRPGG
jgi:small-conductance mechanosensitive channel